MDTTGNAYLTGSTSSDDFPTTGGAYQTSVVNSCSPDPCPNGFATKLNVTGTALVYSTFLDGSNSDGGGGITVDGSGNAYVTGYTASSDFPSAGPAPRAYGGGNDAFVTKLNATGTALVYSTFGGGAADDEGRALALDASGNVYMTGSTTSANFPTLSAFQTTLKGTRDAFITKLNGAGSAIVYSTYLGGNDTDQSTADRGHSASETGNGTSVATSRPSTTAGATASPSNSMPRAMAWAMRPFWAAAITMLCITWRKMRITISM